MPYIDRNQSGDITGIYACQQHDGQEFVDSAEMRVAPLTYSQRRAVAYPPIPDQLDALWKGGNAEEEMRQIIFAVKAEIPKP